MLIETLEYLGIAFICSVILIILSKIILQSLIRRPADYYDAQELLQEEMMLNDAGISITTEHDTNPEGEILEETHLESQLGYSDAPKPEEILAEVPESVTESLEDIHVHTETASEGEDESEEMLDAYETTDDSSEDISIDEIEAEAAAEPEAEEEPAAEVEAEEEPAAEVEPEVAAEPETEEPAAEAEPEPEPEAEEEPAAEAEAETEAEEESEPAVEEESATEVEPEVEVEPEPVTEEEPEPEPEPIGFSIKARTTRERKPIRKAEPEPEEPAADDSGDDEVRGWDETYDEIRDSLQQAYSRSEARKKPPKDDDGSTDKEPSDKSGKKKKKNRHRKQKPSMNMNKKTLTEIALSKGIEIPEGATKRMILDLIQEEKKK